MKRLIAIFALLCASQWGCAKKAPSPETAPPAAAVAEAAPTTVTGEADLAALNEALKKFQQEKGTLPANVGELVTAGYLARAPKAPPGKRFVIDATRSEVRIEERIGF